MFSSYDQPSKKYLSHDSRMIVIVLGISPFLHFFTTVILDS